MIAVMALDVESDSVDLATWLSGDAQQYRPHISILPRFYVDALPSLDLDAAIGRRIALRGPIGQDGGLWWYEVDETNGDWILRLHNDLVHKLRTAIREIAPRFWGSGYRPHMTVGDRAPEICEALVDVTVTSACFYIIERDNPLLICRQEICAAGMRPSDSG